jgi:hypothetical protein
MNKASSCIREFWFTATLLGGAFVGWKLLCRWHDGVGQGAGRSIDGAIGRAAEKLEKAAVTLEEWADSGLSEKVGKDLDDVLMDAKMTLEEATDIVQRALNPAP